MFSPSLPGVTYKTVPILCNCQQFVLFRGQTRNLSFDLELFSLPLVALFFIRWWCGTFAEFALITVLKKGFLYFSWVWLDAKCLCLGAAFAL